MHTVRTSAVEEILGLQFTIRDQQFNMLTTLTKILACTLLLLGGFPQQLCQHDCCESDVTPGVSDVPCDEAGCCQIDPCDSPHRSRHCSCTGEPAKPGIVVLRVLSNPVTMGCLLVSCEVVAKNSDLHGFESTIEPRRATGRPSYLRFCSLLC